MSALNRVPCPECSGEVLILRGAANRRWICCHCQGIINLDVLEGCTETGGAEPDAVEWEPLPTAHAAPPPATNLGPPVEQPAADAKLRPYAAVRTERERAADQAVRRHALVEATRRSRWINASTFCLFILLLLMFFYPSRYEEGAFLPPLNPFFQALPVIFPYFFASPRWYLIVLLVCAAYAIYYGRSWGAAAGFFSLVVVCIAFNFHWAAVAFCAMLAPMFWMVQRTTPRARG